MNDIDVNTREERNMPASQVMPEFRAGRLHSGSKRGPIVRSPQQARAIQIAEARKEGKVIPMRPRAPRVAGSMPQFKKGGMVRKTEVARVDKGERVLTRKEAKKYVARKRREK